MRRWLSVFLLFIFPSAVLFAEQFVFMPLWGNEAAAVAQWSVTTIPLSIERVELNYSAQDTSLEYVQLGYGVYDLELTMPRLQKDFAPQKIEFLLQLYDKQGRPLLAEEREYNLFVFERLDFSFADTASVKMSGLVLDSEPMQIKVWLKSYTDKDGRRKVFTKSRWKKDRNRKKDTEIKIILPRD